MSLGSFTLTTFFSLFTVLDPVGLLPIYLSLTVDYLPEERRHILRRAVLIAFFVTLFFLIFGPPALKYLGVTPQAFSIAGGFLLVMMSAEMLLGRHTAVQSADPSAVRKQEADIAIFPLAIPMLSGPGTFATVVMLLGLSQGDPLKIAIIVSAIAGVLLLAWIMGTYAEQIMRFLGPSGVHIFSRIMAMLLAALGVQFVLNGIQEYLQRLTLPR